MKGKSKHVSPLYILKIEFCPINRNTKIVIELKIVFELFINNSNIGKIAKKTRKDGFNYTCGTHIYTLHILHYTLLNYTKVSIVKQTQNSLTIFFTDKNRIHFYK